MIRAVVLVGIAAGGAGCAAPKAPGAFPKVSYYAQDSAFASAEPLRVSVDTGGAHPGDSLFVSISAVRDGKEC